MKIMGYFLKFFGILLVCCLIGCSSTGEYSKEVKVRHDFGGHGNKVSVKIEPRR